MRALLVKFQGTVWERLQRQIKWVFLLGLAFSLAMGSLGCRTAPDVFVTPKSNPRTALIRDHSLLRIAILTNPTMTTNQEVSRSGFVFLPLNNSLRVTGLTAAQVENKISAIFSSHPQVNVELLGQSSTLLLREGDVVRVSFPGAPNLNTSQSIRRDGSMTLPLVGEIKAVGFSTAELEQVLVDLYSPKLVSKEVTVTLESSTFSVFVSGAVLRPGKVDSSGALTVIQAIMEAGGFDYAKANLQAVRILRCEGQEVQSFVLDLKAILEGKPTPAFYLKPSDIIHVPERFSVF